MHRFVKSKTHPSDVIPDKKWKIVKGDVVQVTKGDDKGKQGKVLKVLRDRNSMIVEGINLVKKHIKSAGEFKGGIFTKESPVHYSSCHLVDPQTKKPTSVYYRFLPDGTKVRISKESEVVIPKPPIKEKRKRTIGPKDTAALDVHKQTFVMPKLMVANSNNRSINDLD